MFGENPVEDSAASPASDFMGYPLRLMRVIHWMNVTVIKACAEFPYLEMDESCTYYLAVLNIALSVLFWNFIALICYQGILCLSSIIHELYRRLICYLRVIFLIAWLPFFPFE